MTGLDVGGQVIVLDELQAELAAGGVAVPHGLSIAGPKVSQSPPPPVPGALPAPCPAGSVLFTYDDQGEPADLPPAAVPIVAAHSPDPPADALAAIKAVPRGADTEVLRDRIVDYLEARFGGPP